MATLYPVRDALTETTVWRRSSERRSTRPGLPNQPSAGPREPRHTPLRLSDTDKKNEPRIPPSSHLTLPSVNRAFGPPRVRLRRRRPPDPRCRASPRTAPPPVPRRHAFRSSPARSSSGGPVARRSPSRMRPGRGERLFRDPRRRGRPPTVSAPSSRHRVRPLTQPIGGSSASTPPRTRPIPGLSGLTPQAGLQGHGDNSRR